MKGAFLGEFEEVVLLGTCILGNEAYANKVMKEVEQHMERSFNLSAIHSALYRMEKKGFLSSKLSDATLKRGGKRKRIFKPTHSGLAALQQIRKTRESLWTSIPEGLLNQSTT